VNTNIEFQDHFSKVSASYAQHRVTYPPELFEYVSDCAPAHDRAWDCATGTGQAAVGLTRHFREVVATDASPKQIEQALPDAKIIYRVAPAENSGIESTTVNVVTVAQALHWLKFDDFYAEVRRVCTPGAIIAVWCYAGFPTFGGEIDILSGRVLDALDPYWPAEVAYVKDNYGAIPVPFSELPPPKAASEVEWDFGRMVGVAVSSSAGQRFSAKNGEAHFESLFEELSAVWGNHETKRHGTQPLYTRVGRVSNV
jgi:hypothetical protein